MVRMRLPPGWVRGPRSASEDDSDVDRLLHEARAAGTSRPKGSVVAPTRRSISIRSRNNSHHREDGRIVPFAEK
jgi:hypothetical protein